MRTMTKKAALLSAALAVTLLSGCACNDRLDALEADGVLSSRLPDG